MVECGRQWSVEHYRKLEVRNVGIHRDVRVTRDDMVTRDDIFQKSKKKVHYFSFSAAV